MKIVLLKSVDNLGQAGEAVEVKHGYFRNFLEPRGMALVASTNNMKIVESRKKKLQTLVAKELSDAQQIKATLDSSKLTFHLRAGDRGQLFGSITSRDVAESIKATHNIEIERRRIDMEILKTLGDHPVKIRVYPGVVATLTATIERLLVEGETPIEELENLPKEVFGGAAIYEDDDD